MPQVAWPHTDSTKFMHTPEHKDIAGRLALLRQAMREHRIDALLVPSPDPPLSA